MPEREYNSSNHLFKENDIVDAIQSTKPNKILMSTQHEILVDYWNSSLQK